MSKKPKIIVILGPTSSGKSDSAIKLAKKFNGEIISADSRQIYRGMDIGTGKVTEKEQGMAKHWMLNIASPKTKFSAAQFKKKVDKIIRDILKRGKLPILCGGTGFWIKAIVDNVFYPEVKPDWKLRKQLNTNSAEELFKILQKLDPQRAKSIDKKNKVRIIRAIEICKKIRLVPPLPLAEENARKSEKDNNYDFLQIGIGLPKEKLHDNIERRLKQRFRSGIIEEVEKLKKQGLSWKKIQSFGLGYFWIPLYLQRKISKEELFEKVFQAEKNYAKRQMTWFRKDKKVKWLDDRKSIFAEVNAFINK
jgi:tRNA dimethylallyltransferase